MGFSKNSTPIQTLVEWEKLGGPKSSSQWVDGRSAKEAAKAWLSGAGGLLPHEVKVALDTHPDFGSVHAWTAEPEVRLRFDSFRGEPRNSDLVLHIEDGHGKYLIAVEAKADEPFGDTVKITREKAKKRLVANPRSNGVKRVDNLVHEFFGFTSDDIRYQLLTACAGALAETKRCGYERTLMLVHEFVTNKTENKNHITNAADLDIFVARLSGGTTQHVPEGNICGPFFLPSEKDCPRLYIGKVRNYLRPWSES